MSASFVSLPPLAMAFPLVAMKSFAAPSCASQRTLAQRPPGHTGRSQSTLTRPRLIPAHTRGAQHSLLAPAPRVATKPPPESLRSSADDDDGDDETDPSGAPVEDKVARLRQMALDYHSASSDFTLVTGAGPGKLTIQPTKQGLTLVFVFPRVPLVAVCCLSRLSLKALASGRHPNESSPQSSLR